MTESTELTEAGRRYAESQADYSIVARVALEGADHGWPDSHVEAAVAVMNEKAELERLDTR